MLSVWPLKYLLDKICTSNEKKEMAFIVNKFTAKEERIIHLNQSETVCCVLSSDSDIEAPNEGYDDSTPGDSKTALEYIREAPLKRAVTLQPRLRGFDLGKELSSFSSCIINPSEAARAGGSSSTPQCPRT